MLTRSNLYAYQHRAIKHLKAHPKSALWVDMGLGKTVSTLTAFADAMRGFESRRMLVVAPLRVARDVWADEVKAWSHLHGLTVSCMVGTRQQRLDAFRTGADIHCINRERLAWLFSGFAEEYAPNKFRQTRKWPWDWITLDESQSFKNQSASRTTVAKRISTFGIAERIVELTGTPAPCGYKDLWSQLFILDHGARLGRTEDAFLKRWFNAPAYGAHKWTMKEGAAAEIQDLVRDIVVSMRAEDYLDLPPVIYNEIGVTLSPRVMKQYRLLERTSVLELAGHTITAANAGVLGDKLLQLASGALYLDNKGNFETLHDEKLDALCGALEELSFSGPVLIGYGYKSDKKRIGTRLDKFCGKSQKWSILRSAAEMKAFARGDIDFGVLHPGSAGHGLNDLHLSGSENIIWFGPTNNLEYWEQLNARIAGGHRRMGKNVRIQVILTRDTVDEAYMAMLRRKEMDQIGLVKALRRKL